MTANAPSHRIAASPSAPEACDRFLDVMEAWTERACAACGPDYAPDMHDGGTFMAPWAVLVRARKRDDVLDRMRAYRDAAASHYMDAGLWHHGYWKTQEAHHGTEHFTIFLHTLWTLAEDDETARQMDDAAEHILHRVAEIPAWFDNGARRFRSAHLGTEVVGDPGPDLPDHLRFIALALQAYEMTRDQGYLDFAAAYGAVWAEAITRGGRLPVALGRDGAVGDLTEEERAAYYAFAGQAPKDFADNRLCAENLIASGAVSVMLDLWKLTGDSLYRQAAEAILDAVAGELANPHAWQVHGNVIRYRQTTESDRYDAALRMLPDEALRPVETLSLDLSATWEQGATLVGTRSDMPLFLDASGHPAPSPILQAARAILDNDESLLARAVDLGQAHLALSLDVFPPYCEHGCGSRSVHAIARGHGRRDGCGVVTSCLQPAIGFCNFIHR